MTRCSRSIRSAAASAGRRAACSAEWTWPFEMANATRRASSVVISISAGPYSRSGPTTKNIAPIVSPRAISGWTIALRASIAWMIPASASLSAVWRAEDLGVVEIGQEDRPPLADGPAAGRGESRAVGKSRIPSRIAWWAASPATAATRRRLPSGSTRSMMQQSARSGIGSEAAAWIVSSRSRVSSRRRPGIGDESGDIARPLALLDVDARAHEPEELPIEASARRSDIQYPAIDPVLPAQAVFDLESVLSRERLIERGAASLHVGRMDRADPTVSDLVLERSAGELQPAPIEERVVAVETGHPDKHRGAVGQIPELALRLEERERCATLIVDVRRRADPALEGTGLAPQRNDAQDVPAELAVVAAEADRGLQWGDRLVRRTPARSELRPLILVDLLDIPEGARLGHRAGVFEPARVRGDHRSVGIREPGKDRQGFDDLAVAPLTRLAGLPLLDLRRQIVERRDRQPLPRPDLDRAGAYDRPPLLAGCTDLEPKDQRVGILANQHAAPRKNRRRDRVAGLVEELEASDRLAGGGREHFLGRRPAAQIGGRLVGIDHPKIRVQDRHARVDRVENLREPVGEDGRSLSIRQMLDQGTPRLEPCRWRGGAFQ